jgi:hypothetical protein
MNDSLERVDIPVHRARLSDNRDITMDDYHNAKVLRKSIAAMVNGREPYVAIRRLDRAFCFADANWLDTPANEYVNAYRYIRDGDYAAVNRLRFYCPFFTGYHLLSLKKRDGLPTVRPVPDDFDNFIEREVPEPDVSIEKWVGASERLPDRYIYRAPAVLGEIGWRVEGTIINYDTFACQDRINLLWEAGLLDRLTGRRPRILEIGAGYGALASALGEMVEPSNYVICDLPESLIFSGLYLLLTHAYECVEVASEPIEVSPGVTLLPNYRFSDLIAAGLRFDLVINTLSMSEMSDHQVHVYADGVSKLIGDQGIFFEQNWDNRHLGFNHCKELICEHLKQRCDLKPTFWSPHHGNATLWANHLDALAPQTQDAGENRL